MTIYDRYINIYEFICSEIPVGNKEHLIVKSDVEIEVGPNEDNS